MFPHPSEGGETKTKKRMITTSIVYDHRGRAKKGMEGPLEVRLTINRKSYYIGTGVRVRERQWAFDKVINHPHAKELNDRLGTLVGRIMQIVNDYIREERDIDILEIRRELWQTNESTDFLTWIDEELKRLDIKFGTYKHYLSLSKRLHEWNEMRTWKDVTADKIIAFDVWLRKRIHRSLHLSDAGRYNYHKNLKHLLSRAESLELITSNPYHKLRGKFKRGNGENTEYLTDDEVSAIMKMTPTPGSLMEQARDLFVFQLWTGLSYQDAEAFDFRRYKKVDGQYRLTASRIKTGEPYVSQLLPPAVEVLKKYDMNTPKICNAVYNRNLHEIGIACGISTRLHSHLARHTFATYMLRNGVKLENVSRMLGHTNIKQTLRYAKVLAEDVHDDFAKINKLLTKK